MIDNGVVPYNGPYGFGGGQLSAFWTPTTGSVILGRRGGMTREKNYDPIEDWQRWPIHAVTGTKPNGKVFTTARNRDPEVTQNVSGSTGVVSVQGVIPRGMLGQPRVLEGRVHYARKFKLSEDSLKLRTIVLSAGQDSIVEPVETIPVFLREAGLQAKATSAVIEFQVGGKWQPAVDQWLEGVTAIRLTRFEGRWRSPSTVRGE